MSKSLKWRVAPAPHNPKNIPKSCWTCRKKGPVTVDWCHCDKDGRNERRKDITPCDDYELDPIWIEVDWLFISEGRA